jgi:alkaline phosphatase
MKSSRRCAVIGIMSVLGTVTSAAAEPTVHTASDVPISAYPARTAMADQFVGVQRNTDVFFKLMRAALGGY